MKPPIGSTSCCHNLTSSSCCRRYPTFGVLQVSSRFEEDLFKAAARRLPASECFGLGRDPSDGGNQVAAGNECCLVSNRMSGAMGENYLANLTSVLARSIKGVKITRVSGWSHSSPLQTVLGTFTNRYVRSG